MKFSPKALFVRAGGACIALAASIAIAHHSAAAFDFMHPITIEGTVKRFEVMNPHTHAILNLSDPKGNRDVEFEGHSASNFYRAGYTRESVHAGEHISILVAPRKDGRDGGFILSFKTASGQIVAFGNLVPGSGKPKE